MVKEKEEKLTAEEKREIQKEIAKTMADSKNLSQELEITLDKLNQAGYKELKHPMFWYMILSTAMRVVRENTEEDTFYDFMEFETHATNDSYSANKNEIEENKGRVN
jgi:hypothetical protein